MLLGKSTKKTVLATSTVKVGRRKERVSRYTKTFARVSLSMLEKESLSLNGGRGREADVSVVASLLLTGHVAAHAERFQLSGRGRKKDGQQEVSEMMTGAICNCTTYISTLLVSVFPDIKSLERYAKPATITNCASKVVSRPLDVFYFSASQIVASRTS